MTASSFSYPDTLPRLGAVWEMDEPARDELLLRLILEAHAHHYERNAGYRSTVAARGVGPEAGPEEMPRLLRSTSQAFKSYIDVLGTPFPQDRPADFVEWLGEQMSVESRPSVQRLGEEYYSLEAVLKAAEHAYSRLGLRLVISTGASGRMALIPRDKKNAKLARESFLLSFQGYLGMKGEHSAMVLGPKRGRAAVDSIIRAAVQHPGLVRHGVYFATPFPEYPDQMRVRIGLTYRQGWRGLVERYFTHPLATTFQTRLLDRRSTEAVISRLVPAAAHDEKVVLLGSLGRLHTVAAFLLDTGRTIALAPGSLLVTMGGAATGNGTQRRGAVRAAQMRAAEMRADLQSAFVLKSGEAAPIHDIYTVAEANWAAVQCSQGNYHIPPWVYAATLDDEDRLQTGPRSIGQLAFFDPLGGGDLFPAFFRTADRVTLVRGDSCPCGAPGCYLEEGSVQDLSGEAGCPGQR